MRPIGEDSAIELTDDTSKCWNQMRSRAKERDLQIIKRTIAYDCAIRVAKEVRDTAKS
jgi:hypothetical protein